MREKIIIEVMYWKVIQTTKNPDFKHLIKRKI